MLLQGMEDLIKDFNSGNICLDNFLKSEAAYNDSIGKTYLYLSEAPNKVVMGYYTISTGSLDYIESGMRYKMGGAAHISHFALDKRYQKMKMSDEPKIYLSDILLYDCIDRIKEIRSRFIGLTYLTLYSTKEGLNLYERNGFENLENDMTLSGEDQEVLCIPMYLPLEEEI